MGSDEAEVSSALLSLPSSEVQSCPITLVVPTSTALPSFLSDAHVVLECAFFTRRNSAVAS